MSCCDDPIYARCGTTFVLKMSLKSAATDTTYFDGLNVRGSIVDCNNVEIMALDSSELVITTGAAGNVTLMLSSTQTPNLSPDNTRRDLSLYVELFDASSPPVVTPYALVPIVVMPDLTA